MWRAYCALYRKPQFLGQGFTCFLAATQNDEANGCLAFEGMGNADDGCFCNCGVIHQCGFNFHGGKPMPTDVHDIIHPTQNPKVAMFISFGAIAREITTGEQKPGNNNREAKPDNNTTLRIKEPGDLS